ncbi:tannase/feruloyl esterase family alpha/beta hydrolase [Novosphingobium cyanobacteriorum]|uniref:Tannase/feruloyl esterase family alpha/beta hydrolase n=1 Tax=Novosphingobium cyanobacteriorum TaxID=3024215 RepID=A0ABT6CIF3_9SPHN|nr:tannase/feruloyl esterase family alpha/beta hydrolase [Novosphingobium cyanobacteriorum]MDF8333696.1 tannase/feruloyl esterase family alpha/beta hydrolase [Novosphingobium cyanobacteriorum]
MAAGLTAVPVRSEDVQGPGQGVCERLQQMGDGDLRVLEAHDVAAGVAPSFYGENEGLRMPAHCLLRGSFGERKGVGGRIYETRFELRMPAAWNGRFLFEGGGNMDGVDWPAHGTLFGRLSPSALERGYAVVRSNGGHVSPGNNSADGTWAVDQQARIDYGYVALDRVAIAAKRIVAAYYGKPAAHSYFVGCSNGGRQAMLVTQKFPSYFDGVVAGNAAFNLIRIAPRFSWATAQLTRISKPGVGAFSQGDMDLVAKGAVKQCDRLDGLADGLIQDVAACRFDPVVLQCKGAKTASCLAAPQVVTLKRLMTGPLDPQGKPYYARLPYDSTPPGWDGVKQADPAAPSLFMDTMRYFASTPPNPTLDARDVHFPGVFKSLESARELVDAEGTMLNSFAPHGKLIIYHGTSDYALSTFELTGWYDRLAKDTGGRTQDWARLFLVPGMMHCGGGKATDEFDPLSAIQDWVEEGRAPDRIIATGKELPGISRPLCPWPKVARYRGGDPKSAESFECS